jgi:hypothetical protein
MLPVTISLTPTSRGSPWSGQRTAKILSNAADPPSTSFLIGDARYLKLFGWCSQASVFHGNWLFILQNYNLYVRSERHAQGSLRDRIFPNTHHCGSSSRKLGFILRAWNASNACD